MGDFNALQVKNDCVEWIRDWFEVNGKGCNAIVGISGGKDSSVVAALCVEALGKERVIGVLMPNGEQADIDCARQLVDFLGIKNYEINVKPAIEAVKAAIEAAMKDDSSLEKAFDNLPDFEEQIIENNKPNKVTNPFYP